MNPNDTHREQLSALIDGALDADQARFLLRRLQHDGELADNLSRWQMAGDVLRGQADAPVCAGFAEAIAARIAEEPLPLIEGEGIGMPSMPPKAQAETATYSPAPRATRWRWFGGGAMAASFAIASVLALRPDTSPLVSADVAAIQTTAPTRSDAQTDDVASVDAVAASAQATLAIQPAVSRAPPPPVAPVTNERATDTVRAPVRVARIAPTPARTSSASIRAVDTEVSVPALVPSTDIDTRTAQAARPAAGRDPFQPPAAKAWPRAAIPGASNGTFNASLDSGSSYYPFEPRTLEPVDGE